jgi:hypothetical protein
VHKTVKALHNTFLIPVMKNTEICQWTKEMIPVSLCKFIFEECGVGIIPHCLCFSTVQGKLSPVHFKLLRL